MALLLEWENVDNIQIGVLSYDIVQGKALRDVSEEWQLGEINYGEAKIHLDDDLTPQVRKQTLMHEIVHGMLNEIGHEEARDDEGLVNGLANQLIMLLQNNPDFVEYFTAKDRPFIKQQLKKSDDWLWRSGYFD